jgi:hypothetical protein
MKRLNSYEQQQLSRAGSYGRADRYTDQKLRQAIAPMPLAQRQAVGEAMSHVPPPADDYRVAITAMREGGLSRSKVRLALAPSKFASARRLGSLTPADFDAILAEVWPPDS